MMFGGNQILRISAASDQRRTSVTNARNWLSARAFVMVSIV
jgi:hypothetical protein